MTRLEEYVQSFVSLPPEEVRRRLQLAGVIADTCIELKDVADADLDRATEWIAKNIDQ